MWPCRYHCRIRSPNLNFANTSGEPNLMLANVIHYTVFGFLLVYPHPELFYHPLYACKRDKTIGFIVYCCSHSNHQISILMCLNKWHVRYTIYSRGGYFIARKAFANSYYTLFTQWAGLSLILAHVPSILYRAYAYT